MSGGITENDVWQACDSLLLEGARPTIERVRQKIGRGSPNTVSSHLDTWFQHLGGRIKDPRAFAAPPDIPDPVQQAALHFWRAAVAESRRDFDQKLGEGMAAAISNVEAEKERAALADAAAFEANKKLANLQSHAEALAAHLETARIECAAARAELGSEKGRITALESRLSDRESELATQRSAHQEAVEAAHVRADGATRRAALEVEHERQARSRTEKKLSEVQTKLEAAHGLQASERAAHASALEALRGDLRIAKRELEIATESLLEERAEVGALKTQLCVAVSRADRSEAASQLTPKENATKRTSGTARRPQPTRRLSKTK